MPGENWTKERYNAEYEAEKKRRAALRRGPVEPVEEEKASSATREPVNFERAAPREPKSFERSPDQSTPAGRANAAIAEGRAKQFDPSQIGKLSHGPAISPPTTLANDLDTPAGRAAARLKQSGEKQFDPSRIGSLAPLHEADPNAVPWYRKNIRGEDKGPVFQRGPITMPEVTLTGAAPEAPPGSNSVEGDQVVLAKNQPEAQQPGAAPPGAGGGGAAAPATSERQAELDAKEEQAQKDYEQAVKQGSEGVSQGYEDQAQGAIGLAGQANSDRMAREAEANDIAETKREVQRASILNDQEGQALAKKQIDPNHFWASRNTGQVIMGILGLMLGGFSAGMTGGKNTAWEMLQHAIDQDVEAQKADLARSTDLNTARQSIYAKQLAALGGDREAATHAAQAAGYKVAEYTIQSLMAGVKSREATANGMEAAAKAQLLYTQKMSELEESRKRGKAGGGGGAAGLPAGSMHLDQDNMVHIGDKDYLMPKAEAEKVRSTLDTADRIDGAITQIEQARSQYSLGHPIDSIKAQRVAEAATETLRATLASMEKARWGKLTDSLLEVITGDPAGFVTGHLDLGKLKAIRKSVQEVKAATLKNAGPFEANVQGYSPAGKTGMATMYGTVGGRANIPAPANPNKPLPGQVPVGPGR
jgi:hypothetical protein